MNKMPAPPLRRPKILCCAKGCGQPAAFLPRVLLYVKGAAIPDRSGLMEDFAVCAACRKRVKRMEDLLGANFVDTMGPHFERMGRPRPVRAELVWESLVDRDGL